MVSFEQRFEATKCVNTDNKRFQQITSGSSSLKKTNKAEKEALMTQLSLVTDTYQASQVDAIVNMSFVQRTIDRLEDKRDVLVTDQLN